MGITKQSPVFESLLSERAQYEAPAVVFRARDIPSSKRSFDYGGGRPDPASFPYEELTKATATMLRRDGAEALNYGTVYGYDKLRDLVVDKLKSHEDIEIRRENVLITHGASNAISLFADTFLDVGDPIIVEAPTFMGSLRTFDRHRARTIGVPVDEQGMDVDALGHALAELARKGERAKFIYTIVNFQNPAGPTLPLARREQLLALANQYETLVLEDDAYGELRFEGEHVRSLIGLDNGEIVARCSTFSKILAAGLRCGYLIAEPEILAHVSSFNTSGTNYYINYLVYEYLSQHMDDHIRELIGVYRAKRDAVLDGLEYHLKGEARWSRPEGGFFIWVELPEGVDPEKLAQLAFEENVNYIPGSPFFPDGRQGSNFVRLATSYMSVKDLRDGMDVFCPLVKKARR